MKKIFKLWAPDGVPAGGEPTPAPAPAPAVPGEPASVDMEAIKAEIRAQVIKEMEEKKKKDAEMAKLDETEKLKKVNADLEAKILEMEQSQKREAFASELKSLAIAAGASKTDALVKLADSSKSPADAVKELKTNYPELFIKAPTIGDLGGGASGSPTNNKTAEDIGKMSMAEYTQWRKNQK